MNLQNSFLKGMAVIFIMQIIVAFSAINLLERLGPASESVLGRHELALKQIDGMLSALAKWEASPMTSQEFTQYLGRLSELHTDDIQEEAERNMQQLRAFGEGPRWKELRDRTRVIGILNALSELHWQSMHRANEQVRFLGVAGGWAILFLTALSLLFGWIFQDRLRRSVIHPISDLCQGLSDWQKGNRMRRFRYPEASDDLQKASTTINDLLDYAHQSPDFYRNQ